jgi:hypothetical protein
MMSIEPSVNPDRVAVSADNAAVAALHELPRARILVFDGEFQIILSAGEPLEHDAGSEPAVCREGAFVGDAFPESLWKLIEPLCRSALQGETRSREISAADDGRFLMVDVGPLSLEDPAARAGQPSPIAGGVAVIFDIAARRAADEIARSSHEDFEQVFERAPIGMGLLDWTAAGHWSIARCARSRATPPRS